MLTTAATVGSYLGGMFAAGSTASTVAYGVGYAGTVAALGYAGNEAMGSMTPDMPDAPEPEAEVEKGDEGIRQGEMARTAKRRALGQAYLTRGQPRADDLALGGMRQTLG